MTAAVKIEQVPLFQGLSKRELELVRTCLREKSFTKGEVLFREGQGCERVFIVKAGRIKIIRTASTGREQILETLEPGDTCACNPGNVVWFCSSTAMAAIPSEVWFLRRDDYVRLVRSNEAVSHTLNEIFAKRLQCFTSLIEEVSLKDARKRLVKFLLDMLARKKQPAAKNEALFIPFTREEIAQRLGTSRETVARYLTQLKEAGLIELKPYQIVILDRAGLEKLLG
jgi:CRP/FNR family transcriptional regulator